jgi:hypothetical protein
MTPLRKVQIVVAALVFANLAVYGAKELLS